jgi:hypothetical protein
MSNRRYAKLIAKATAVDTAAADKRIAAATRAAAKYARYAI